MEPQEPTTPTTEVTWDQLWQKPTPVKARIQGAIDFLKSEGITGKNEAVFQANGVSHATGYRILRSSKPRTLKNDPTREETRRGHNNITPERICEMEKILENEGLEGRSLTWMQLGFEAQVEASEATIRRAMGTLQYHKCLACRRGWQSPSSKKNRVQFAESMLARYPNPEDWDCVRFSNEVHTLWVGATTLSTYYSQAWTTLLCRLYST